MALMRAHHRQGAQHRGGLRTGLKFRGSIENGGLVECFFGKDGKERLQHDKFFQFMRDLHDEVSCLHLLQIVNSFETYFVINSGHFACCH
jgi:hypothetical protein